MNKQQWEAIKNLKPVGPVMISHQTRAQAGKKVRHCACGHGSKHHSATRCKRRSCKCGLARKVFG